MTHKVLPTITYESMDNQAPRASVEVWLVSTRPQKKEAIEEQRVHTGIMKKKKSVFKHWVPLHVILMPTMSMSGKVVTQESSL